MVWPILPNPCLANPFSCVVLWLVLVWVSLLCVVGVCCRLLLWLWFVLLVWTTLRRTPLRPGPPKISQALPFGAPLFLGLGLKLRSQQQLGHQWDQHGVQRWEKIALNTIRATLTVHSKRRRRGSVSTMTPHQCWDVCDWKTTERDQPNEAQLSSRTCTHRESEKRPTDCGPHALEKRCTPLSNILTCSHNKVAQQTGRDTLVPQTHHV